MLLRKPNTTRKNTFLHRFFFIRFILFYLFSISYQLTSISYTNPQASSFSTYRLAYINSQVTLFTSKGVFVVDSSVSGSTISPSPSYTTAFNTLKYTSNVIETASGTYAIGGVSGENVLEFDSTGSIVGQDSLSSPASDQLRLILSRGYSSKVTLGYIDTSLEGIISVYDSSTKSINIINSQSSFVSSTGISFPCVGNEVDENTLCFFSKNNNEVWYNFYDTIIQLGSDLNLYSGLSGNVNSIMFNYVPDPQNNLHKPDVFLVMNLDDGHFILALLEGDDSTGYITYSERIHIDETFSVTEINDCLVFETKVVIVVNNNRLIFYSIIGRTISSTTLEAYSSISNAEGIAITKLDSESSFAIVYREITSSTTEHAILFDTIQCIDATLSSFVDIDLEITPNALVDASSLGTNSINDLMIHVVSTPSRGVVKGVDSSGSETTINAMNNLRSYPKLIYSCPSTPGVVTFDFSLQLPILSSIYVPSFSCTASLSIVAVAITCDLTKAIFTTDGRCVDILGGVTIGKDKSNNKYYMFNYIDLTLREFRQNYKKILSLIDTLIKNDQITSTGETVPITYINLNGKDYSFYYLVEKNSMYLPNNLAFISLKKCKSVLKSQHSLNESDEIYISQFDFINNKKESVHQTEYSVSNSKREELDLNYCKKENAQVEVSYPLNELNQTFTELAYNLSLQGINIFDTNDSFYNDICHTFTAQNERDVTLKDRRLEFYPNFTMCEGNCSFLGVNFTTNHSICLCEPKTEIILEEREGANDDFKFSFKNALPKTNLLVVKCAKTLFTLEMLYKNYGFYIQLILLISISTLLFFFFIKGTTIINKELKKLTTYSKPTMKIIKFSNNDSTTKPQLNYSSIMSGLISSKNASNIGNSFIYNNNSSFDNSNTIIKEPHTKGKTISTSKVNSSEKGRNDGENSKKVLPSSVQKNELKHSDNHNKQQRTYLNILQINHPLINIIIEKEIFNRVSVRLAYYLSSISLSLVLNAMLYTQSTISENYHYEFSITAISFILTNQIMKSIYSFLISVAINIPMHFLSYGYRNVDNLAKVNDYRFDAFMYQREARKAKKKVIIYSGVNSVLLLFYLYYTSVFCSVYPNSQISWLEGSLISIIIALALPFLTSIVILGLDRCGKKTGMSFIKKAVNRLLD